MTFTIADAVDYVILMAYERKIELLCVSVGINVYLYFCEKRGQKSDQPTLIFFGVQNTSNKIWHTYHGLRGSASPVLTATGIVNGRWQISTPTESTPLDRSPKKFGTGDYIGGLYGWVKFGKNSSMGGFWTRRKL